MTFKDLDIMKNELIDTLESYIFNSARLNFLIKLIKGTEADDLDFAEVLEDGTAVQLIDLLLDCYDSTEFIEWLDRMNYKIFRDYRFSTRVYRAHESDEEWQSICDDSLVSTDSVAVLSW